MTVISNYIDMFFSSIMGVTSEGGNRDVYSFPTKLLGCTEIVVLIWLYINMTLHKIRNLHPIPDRSHGVSDTTKFKNPT